MLTVNKLVCTGTIDVTKAKSKTTSCVASTIVGEDDKGFTIRKLAECKYCIIGSVVTYRTRRNSTGLNVINSIIPAVCTIINLSKSTVLVKNDCRTVTVSLKSTCVVLVKDNHGIVLCLRLGSISYLGIVKPLAVNCLELLAVDSDKLRLLVTLALRSTYFLCASSVGTLSAVLTNVLTCVCGNVVALTLGSANFLGTGSVGTLTTVVTYGLTLVAGALGYASSLSAISIETAAALSTLRLALMSLEGDAGKSYLCANSTVGVKEGSGNVAVAVRSYKNILTGLARFKCLLEVTGCGTSTVLNTAGVSCIKVLSRCTVIDTNDLTILVDNYSYAVAIGPVKSTCIIRCVDDEEILTKNSKILIYCNKIFKSGIRIIVNLNLNRRGSNLNNTSYGSGVGSICCFKSNVILTLLFDVEAAVILYNNSYSNIIRGIKSTVIVGSSYASNNLGVKSELGISSINDGIVTGKYGSLIYVRSDNLSGINPNKTNNIAVCTDNVPVHETTTVSINARTCISGLNNDCVAACRNNHILCELVNINPCGRASTGRITLVHEKTISSVTTLDYNSVSSDDSCNAVTAADIKSDLGRSIVVEYATYSVVVCLAIVELNILCVLEVKKVAGPLLLTENVLLNLKAKSGESLVNNYGTGSSYLYAELVHCKVGDGVYTLNVSVEAVVVINDNSSVLITLVRNCYAEHKVDILACVDLNLSGIYSNNRGGCYNVTLALGCASGLGAVSISTLATLFTNALALVSRSNFVTLTLFSASRLGAISIGTLAALCTNTLALVSGSLVGSLMTLALSSASCISAFSVKAMATLRTYALTNVRLYVRCRGVNEVLNCIASCEAKHCNKNQRDNCQNS